MEYMNTKTKNLVITMLVSGYRLRLLLVRMLTSQSKNSHPTMGPGSRLERSKSDQVTFVGFVWHRLFLVKSTSQRKICVMYL